MINCCICKMYNGLIIVLNKFGKIFNAKIYLKTLYFKEAKANKLLR